MSLSHLGSFNLGEINVGLFAALGFINPLAAQLDLFISAQFGFGPLLADLQAQFNALLAAAASIGLQISTPFIYVNLLASLAASLAATLQAALAFGLPTVSLNLAAQLTAILGIIADLELRIGGLQGLIAAGIAIKLPALEFLGEFLAHMSAGPAHLISWTGAGYHLADAGADINSLFSFGLDVGGPDEILPYEDVSGVLIVTKNPAVWAALGFIIKVS
jgi:hypothetical protein